MLLCYEDTRHDWDSEHQDLLLLPPQTSHLRPDFWQYLGMSGYKEALTNLCSDATEIRIPSPSFCKPYTIRREAREGRVLTSFQR